MGLRTFLRRRRERSLGQSLVEFAIILPVFLVILSAAIDLGRMAYARVTIANVAREASFQGAKTRTSYHPRRPCSTTAPRAKPRAEPPVEPCTQPSAGFTYVTSPLNDTDSPVTVVVTDTSTASAGCEIDSRGWTWGDGTTSANPASPA